MKITANGIRIQYNENHKTEVILTTKIGSLTEEYNKLKQAVEKGKELAVEIKIYRKARSLDANSYAWLLIAKIADVLRTDKNSVYIEMLKRYGQREKELLSVVSEAVDMVYRATDNHCCVVGGSELKDKTFKHIAILKGSSGYDTKEMSILIDGIVSDCKEHDIETLMPRELSLLKEKWRNQNDRRYYNIK